MDLVVITTVITSLGGGAADRGGSTTNNFSGTFTGSNVSAGNHNTQNMTTGLDTTKVLEFAQFVSEALPALGLSEQDRDIVEADIVELQEQARSADAEPGWLQGLINKILPQLASSSSTMIANTATELGEQALGALQTAITGG